MRQQFHTSSLRSIYFNKLKNVLSMMIIGVEMWIFLTR